MLTAEQAASVIQILNEECRASIGDDAYAFTRYVTGDHEHGEWRFMGALGFGGKFRFDGGHHVPYVDCYPEHITPERHAMTDKANARLRALFSTGGVHAA